MKNSTIKSFILLALLFIPATILYAIPAYPYPVTYTQPNGDTLTVRIKGDEKIHWYESMDEYTLLVNKSGYLTYAQLDENGDLQPTEYVASNIEQRDFATLLFLKNLEKKLFYSKIQVDILLQVWQIEEDMMTQDDSKGDRAVSGKRKGIVALIGFSDKPFSLSTENFNDLLNQAGYTGTVGTVIGNGNGSVKDYFKEVSYGTLDFSFTVFGPYTAPLPLTSYEDNNPNGSSNIRNMVRWVLNEKIIKEAKVDFRDYDLDNNKALDGFHFIFAGRGAEQGMGVKSIWSHAGYISNPEIINNGVKLTRYSCSPELTTDNSSKKVINTIGVVCHEMTHCLGAADFYDTDYELTGGTYPGCGDWCLMSSGCYNATAIQGASGTSGNTPAHQNIFIKIQFGWVKPIVIDSPGYVEGMPNSAENQYAFRINTKTNNEYYLLENRQQVGFDTKVPGKGLLVYHVHKDVNNAGNCINCGHPQKMYVVDANQIKNFMPNDSVKTYGTINNANCTFPNGGKTSFTDETKPAMWSWANEPTEKPITNITHQNGLIGFDFMGGGDINIGISEYEKTSGTNSIKIVPNPANDYFELRITNYESQIHQIDIYNSLGQLVKSVPFQGESNNGFSSQKISITDLNKGFYFVKAGNASAKLIISAY